MGENDLSDVFTGPRLDQMFPDTVTNRFFEALFGDASEGTYDIRLTFDRSEKDRLEFQFQLKNRPGECLRCNLTYGLPEVFSRHPVIDVNGLVEKIGGLLNGRADIDDWALGKTREISQELHVIPLTVYLKKTDPSR